IGTRFFGQMQTGLAMFPGELKPGKVLMVATDENYFSDFQSGDESGALFGAHLWLHGSKTVQKVAHQSQRIGPMQADRIAKPIIQHGDSMQVGDCQYSSARTHIPLPFQPHKGSQTSDYHIT